MYAHVKWLRIVISYIDNTCVFQMFHPYCIDTSVIYNLTGIRKMKPGLKKLAAHFLGWVSFKQEMPTWNGLGVFKSAMKSSKCDCVLNKQKFTFLPITDLIKLHHFQAMLKEILGCSNNVSLMMCLFSVVTFKKAHKDTALWKMQKRH